MSTKREEWERGIARWRQSGQTMSEFAAGVGVSLRTSSCWKCRLAKEQGLQPAAVVVPEEALAQRRGGFVNLQRTSS